MDARSIFRRVQGLFQVGRVTVAGVGTGNTQTAQVTVSGKAVRDAMTIMQHYGFESALPVGTDVAILSLSGDATGGVAVGSVKTSARIKTLTSGQVCIYTAAGDQVLLDNGGSGITLKPAGGTVKIEGDGHITGKLTVDGDATIDGVDFIKHYHTGVETGSGQTGTPAS